MAPSTPLVDPREYFDRWDRPSLGFATGIVFVEAVLTAVLLWVFLQRVIVHVDAPSEETSGLQGTVALMAVGVFVAIFLGWALAAAILHVFVWLAGGSRGFGTTLAVAGESELATVILLPLTGVGLVSLLGQAPADPAAFTDFFERVTSFSSPLLLTSTLLSTLWKAAIQGYGLADAHDLPLEKMLLVAFGVGLFGWLLNLL